MCVLRAFGEGFDPREFLRTSSLTAYSVYRRGEQRFKLGNAVYENSGLRIDVSAAGWSDRESQFKDAIEFLRARRAELERLVHWPGVEGVVLDFPFEADNTATFIRFPIALAREASGLDIALEISVYPRLVDQPSR